MKLWLHERYGEPIVAYPEKKMCNCPIGTCDWKEIWYEFGQDIEFVFEFQIKDEKCTD